MSFDWKPAVLFVMTLSAASCSGGSTEGVQAAEMRQELAEAFEAVRSYGHGRREEFADTLQDGIAASQARAEELRAAAARKSGAAREKLEQLAGDLDERRAELANQLRKVKDATPEAWAELRDGAAGAFDSLHTSVEDAADALSD